MEATAVPEKIPVVITAKDLESLAYATKTK